MQAACTYWDELGSKRTKALHFVCDSPGDQQVFYRKEMKNVTVCEEHARLVRANNNSLMAAVRRRAEEREGFNS